MNTDKSALLHERASNITRRCEDLKDNEMFFMLQRNLRQAVEQSSATGPAPLVVTIIGGTGVGKSFIFSSLCATPEISPSSSSVRGYTKELFVAAAPEDRSLLPFSSDEAHYLPGLLPGAILIDTPDLDTINSNNARLARETIRVSDILIVVTTPDKRSNFAIHQNVVEWASRKRWFFVINKTDTAPDATNESLKKDLADRLQQIGFSVDPGALFAFSARQPDSDEFRRFRDLVYSPRTVVHSRILREEADLRRILHALNAEKTAERILRLQQELIDYRTTLSAQITEQHQLVVTSPAITGLAGDALRSSIYRELAGNNSLFLYPWFATISWFSPGVTAENADRAVEAALAENFRFSGCRVDERRFLEDRNLPATQPGNLPAAVPTTGNGETFMQILETAQRISETPLMRFYIIIGNILPSLVLLSALYRAAASWISGIWLPTDFFVHAVTLIIIATLPGYLLVSKGIARMSERFVLKPSKQAINLHLLDASIAGIDKILQETSLLNSSAETQLKEMQHLLPQSSCGITARNL
ncbi:MAG TPA: GTPase domain-containing protein [Candidatus Rifleibacterium sp.]|jgi:hypothetical protein|nr:GTPase domain-containing protein [Candidatus Rifleibacterium sp.]HQB82417.1 GTPase domain-containing protein [Candidatus Rifleibacterium sp.]